MNQMNDIFPAHFVNIEQWALPLKFGLPISGGFSILHISGRYGKEDGRRGNERRVSYRTVGMTLPEEITKLDFLSLLIFLI